MPVTVDLGGMVASLPTWRDVHELETLEHGRVYRAPESFEEGSLRVYLNGQTLDIWSDNGFVELNETDFELKIPVPTIGGRSRLFVSYVKK